MTYATRDNPSIFQFLYPVFMAVGIGYFFLKNQIKKLFINSKLITKNY
jgi:hypothetical protein